MPDLSPIPDMTQGQLLLHFGAICGRHGADGVRSLTLAGRLPVETLRASLLAYEAAMEAEDFTAAETTLIAALAGAMLSPPAAGAPATEEAAR